VIELDAPRARDGAARCVYCHASVAGEAERATCPGCGATYHAACRRELGRCGTPGCAHALVEAPSPARPEPPAATRSAAPPTTEAPREPLSVYLGGGAVLVGGTGVLLTLVLYMTLVRHPTDAGLLRAALGGVTAGAVLGAAGGALLRFLGGVRRPPAPHAELQWGVVGFLWLVVAGLAGALLPGLAAACVAFGALHLLILYGLLLVGA
jgi:hypothetical protein